MSRIPLTLIARAVTGFLISMIICQFVVANRAECKSQVHIRKKFIPKPYDWKSVGRVAILPIEHSYGAAGASKSRKRSSLEHDFPSDSALGPLLVELRRRIQILDSSIVVFTLGKPTFQLSESEFAKVAGNIPRADAVLSVKVTELDYNKATPEVSGIYAMGAPLPPIAAKPASIRAQMTFTMKDAKYGEIIWQVDANGKAMSGAASGGSSDAGTAELEVLLKDIIIVAGSWLPFGIVEPE